MLRERQGDRLDAWLHKNDHLVLISYLAVHINSAFIPCVFILKTLYLKGGSMKDTESLYHKRKAPIGYRMRLGIATLVGMVLTALGLVLGGELGDAYTHCSRNHRDHSLHCARMAGC
jgi:hypothetical protein